MSPTQHTTRHYVYRLIPPRPTFDEDATSDEQAVMARHVVYWNERVAQGDVLIFGPVRDGNGASGLAIVQADDRDAVDAIGADDPAVTSGLCTVDVGVMPVSITPG